LKHSVLLQGRMCLHEAQAQLLMGALLHQADAAQKAN
jgi:hypothetical protein